MSNTQTYTLPNSYAIKRLKDEDFSLEAKDKICLYEDTCTLVLFYNESLESKRMLGIFKSVAETVAGAVFAACNLALETDVGVAFTEVNNMKDHPFHWVTVRPCPFIVVYRNGYPVNFYDGPPDTSTLINFSLNIACLPEFHSRNYHMIERVKEEMWTNYRIRNPTIVPQIAGDDDIILPAIPATRMQNI